MAKDDYLPRKETTIMTWLNNYKNKITAYAPLFGLSPAEAAEQVQMCNDIIAEVNTSVQLRAAMKSQNAKKKAVMKKNLNKIRKTVKGFKFTNNYTSAIGADLGAEGIKRTKDFATASTTIRGNAIPKMVRIRWTKKNIDAVKIFTKLENEQQWQLLNTDLRSPSFDTRPLADGKTAEIRQYCARPMIGDTEAGQMSNIITVVFGG